LYTENYKLLREIKKGLNEWEDIPYSQTGRFNIVEMSILPKAIYRISAITIQILIAFSGEMEKPILKFT